jgi:hypothetical protein
VFNLITVESRTSDGVEWFLSLLLLDFSDLCGVVVYPDPCTSLMVGQHRSWGVKERLPFQYPAHPSGPRN